MSSIASSPRVVRHSQSTVSQELSEATDTHAPDTLERAPSVSSPRLPASGLGGMPPAPPAPQATPAPALSAAEVLARTPGSRTLFESLGDRMSNAMVECVEASLVKPTFFEKHFSSKKALARQQAEAATRRVQALTESAKTCATEAEEYVAAFLSACPEHHRAEVAKHVCDQVNRFCAKAFKESRASEELRALTGYVRMLSLEFSRDAQQIVATQTQVIYYRGAPL